MLPVVVSMIMLAPPPTIEILERAIDPCGKKPLTVDGGEEGSRTRLLARGTCTSPLVKRVVIDGEGPTDGHVVQPMFVQEAFGTKPVTLEFYPAEDWSPRAVRVETAEGPAPIAVVVEIQTTKIMQCNDEGPHVELWDWKRASSAWTPLVSREGAWVVAAPPEPTFPESSERALKAAVAKAAPGFPTTSCAPVVGETRLRVRASSDGAKWTTVSEVVLRPALGC